MRDRGLDNDVWQAYGSKLFVVESRCHHSRPLRYGTKFVVSAWLKEVRARRFTLSYEIRFSEGQWTQKRAARGRTHFATTNIAGELGEIPDGILSLLVRPCDSAAGVLDVRV